MVLCDGSPRKLIQYLLTGLYYSCWQQPTDTDIIPNLRGRQTDVIIFKLQWPATVTLDFLPTREPHGDVRQGGAPGQLFLSGARGQPPPIFSEGWCLGGFIAQAWRWERPFCHIPLLSHTAHPNHRGCRGLWVGLLGSQEEKGTP